jgi:hypothetical protein
MSAQTAFGVPEGDKLAALIFELASQLHVERVRRLALETAMIRAGLISETGLESLADDDAFIARSRAALDEAMDKLMRVLTENADPRMPLRDPK